MAYDADSGIITDFPYNDKTLAEAIEEYKRRTAAGEVQLPSWPDFCAFLGCPDDKLEEVMERGFTKKGAYYNRAMMLKNMGLWCEAQLVSHPNWGGKMAVKAMFLLKQGFGRSRKYQDEKSGKKAAGVGAVRVTFGDEDPRGKKAAK